MGLVAQSGKRRALTVNEHLSLLAQLVRRNKALIWLIRVGTSMAQSITLSASHSGTFVVIYAWVFHALLNPKLVGHLGNIACRNWFSWSKIPVYLPHVSLFGQT